jgi:protein involved in polysaccharide export with SLBB domain
MKKVFIIFILLLSFSISYAQMESDFGGGGQYYPQTSDRPAQYILGSGDILLININLWGFVQRPGIYSIPSSYTLIDLISSAGGPRENSRLSEVRIVRKNQEVIVVDVEEFLKTGDSGKLPVLQPGDTVVVPGSLTNIFLNIVAFMRDVAIIVNVFVLANRI